MAQMLRLFPNSSPAEIHTKIWMPLADSWLLWYEKVTTSSKSSAEKSSHSKLICWDGSWEQSGWHRDEDWATGVSRVDHKIRMQHPWWASPCVQPCLPHPLNTPRAGKSVWFIYRNSSNCSHRIWLWIGPCLLWGLGSVFNGTGKKILQ